MNNQEILDRNYDPNARSLKLIGDCAMWSIEKWHSIADIKRIVELEAYLKKVQADRINDIAIERKRWAKADLVALEILRLEQQANALSDYACSNKPLTKRGLNIESIALSEKANALKEPKP